MNNVLMEFIIYTCEIIFEINANLIIIRKQVWS